MYGSNESGYGGGFDFFANPLPRVVKILLWVNITVFAVAWITSTAFGTEWPERLLALDPKAAVEGFHVWQFLTYAYLHDLDWPFHILINMLMLWMFGGDIARYFGPRRFLVLYHVAAFIGGVGHVVAAYAKVTDGPVVGASGAIYGMLTVYALLYPNRTILVFLMFPMRMKYFILIMVGIDFVSGTRLLSTGVAHFCHLGGALGGFLFFRYHRRIEAMFDRMEERANEREVQREVDVRQTVDELLEKIRRDGIHTLSAKEKRFLTNASKLYKKEDHLP